MAYCRRYCPPGYDPEDIAQEALAKAWSSWDRYSPSRPFWPWVATIARRLCVDYWRRDERAVARAGGAAALEPCPQPRPDELSEAADECRMAVTAFRRLRPDHQRIVGLRDIEGWSYEDIARFEGVTVESIRGSLRRARLSLRKSYDTLAKGGVPALAPLGALLKSWESARVRLASRMARWQANLQDAGMASSRLGEAIVSLMALSVAAVGLGAPTTGVALQAEGDAPAAQTDAVAGAAASGATDPVASGADLQPPANSGTAGGAVGVLNGEFTPRNNGNVIDVNPLEPADPSESIVGNFNMSPNYENDGTIFGVAGRAGCVATCYTIFKSTDRGATWTDLQSIGLTSSRLLLPPAYPEDNRIFATGYLGLQVSNDGGRSFATVLPSKGVAAMSPGFSAGDPRIFMPDAPGLQYDAEKGAPEPLNLRPGPSSTSHEFSFGFPTNYDPADPVIYVGASIPKAQGATSVFYRCRGTSCDSQVVLPELMDAPRITVVAMPDGRDAIFAVSGERFYRSFDGGATFARVERPAAMTGALDEVTDGRGRLYVRTSQIGASQGDIWYTDDAGSSWANIPDPGGYATKVTAFAPLPNGALLVAMFSDVTGFACTYDGGRTWSPSC